MYCGTYANEARVDIFVATQQPLIDDQSEGSKEPRSKYSMFDRIADGEDGPYTRRHNDSDIDAVGVKESISK